MFWRSGNSMGLINTVRYNSCNFAHILSRNQDTKYICSKGGYANFLNSIYIAQSLLCVTDLNILKSGFRGWNFE